MSVHSAVARSFRSPAHRIAMGVRALSSSQLKQMPATAFLGAVCISMYLTLALTKVILVVQFNEKNHYLSVLSARVGAVCAIAAFQDLVFVVCWALAGALLLACARPRTRLRCICEWSYLLASVLSVAYAFLNVTIFAALHMPLTYPLLQIAGHFSDVRSSLADYVTFRSMALILAGPLLYLAMVAVLLQSLWIRKWKTYAILAGIVALYLPAGAYGYAKRFSGNAQVGLAESAHWAMLRSLGDHWLTGAADQIPDAGSAANVDDFLTAGDRGASRLHKVARSPIKNVIVVVLESTGTQYMSVYGSRYRTTPKLEAEARNSAVYPNVYSNDGYTLFSMMPLLLSTYPGSGWTIYAAKYPHIAGTTAAEVLHRRGYRTAFMTSQSLHFHGILRFFQDRGFDEVDGSDEFRAKGAGTVVSSWGIDDASLFDQLLQWIEKKPGKPFYAMIWTQQTHHPYPLASNQKLINFGLDTSTRDGRDLNLYLNDLHLADEQLGRLFSALRKSHLADSTLVVITGDHGEAFGTPHGFHYHGTTIYQEGVNVPMILWNPTLFKGGRHSNVVGAHIDLNPTVFDLLGLPLPASWQGYSLMDPHRPPPAYFTCNAGYLLEGVRQGNDKYIYNATSGTQELFDLATDPTEQHNMAEQKPELCRQYRQRLATWMSFQEHHLQLLASGATEPEQPQRSNPLHVRIQTPEILKRLSAE
jgi:arylsulfatase A-like enzyme